MSKTNDEIWKLRSKLLALGQPIIITASEQKPPEDAGDTPPGDITIYPVFEVE